VDLGIVGLPLSGKTTVFNALTHGHAETGVHGGGVETHIGVVKVHDERLEKLAAHFQSKKVTPAEVRYWDFPAMAFGKGGPSGQFLSTLARADALLHVVRLFQREDIPHPEGSIDPHRDIAALNMELSFADLGVVERRLERLDPVVRSAKAGEREAGEREMELLRRVKAGLEGESGLPGRHFAPEEEKALRDYSLLSLKPVLLTLNVGEEDCPRMAALEEEFGARYPSAEGDLRVAALCGQVEMELAELSEEEEQEFRQSMGVLESGVQRVLAQTFDLLGLVTFYTVVGEECRAWTVPQGTPAVKAAGKIHTDMEHGFIRAEVIGWEEMLRQGTLAEARKHGVLRTEGKGYVVQDGDVLHILFNI